MIALIYVEYVLFFGPNQDKIDEVFKEIEDSGLFLTVEEDVYALLGVEVNIDNQSVKVTMAQEGLNKNVMNTVGMIDSNKKTHPA